MKRGFNKMNENYEQFSCSNFCLLKIIYRGMIKGDFSHFAFVRNFPFCSHTNKPINWRVLKTKAKLIISEWRGKNNIALGLRQGGRRSVQYRCTPVCLINIQLFRCSGPKQVLSNVCVENECEFSYFVKSLRL